MRQMNRRDFLKRVGSGVAVAAVPAAFAGCASRASLLRPGAPAPGIDRARYFEAFGVDVAMLQRVLDRALSRGGDFSEVFLQHHVNHWLVLEDGAVNQAYTTVELGAGIRVLKADTTGYAYCEELTEPALLAAAQTAAAVAEGPPSPAARPLKVTPAPDRYPIALSWEEVGAQDRLPVLQRADRVARGRDPRITSVAVYLSDDSSHILVANSEGLLIGDWQPLGYLYVSCTAAHQGRTENGYRNLQMRDDLHFFTPARVDGLARETADQTLALFDAVPPPVGELPVVLAPGPAGVLLHEAVGHGMEADFARKGTSIYAGRIGQRVAPAGVTIIDDGTAPHQGGSINIDDEGTEGQRTVLVEDGILRSYLHDRISARHFGVARTGSGRRESYRHPPVPRMRTTFMERGAHAPAEIIGEVKKGLYADMFSGGSVAIGAGDFTFFVKVGRLIENGRLGPVVKDANLTGNGPRVLESVRRVGNDLVISDGGWSCGKDEQSIPVGVGLPTVLIGGVSIGGREG